MAGESPLARYGILPRGLSRFEAARYIGVGASTFDHMVADGRMPKAKRINRRKVWDRTKIDEAFAAIGAEPQGSG